MGKPDACHFSAEMREARRAPGSVWVKTEDNRALTFDGPSCSAVLTGYEDRPLSLGQFTRATIERLCTTNPVDDSTTYTYTVALWIGPNVLLSLSEKDRYASWDHPRGSTTGDDIWATAKALAALLNLPLEELRIEG